MSIKIDLKKFTFLSFYHFEKPTRPQSLRFPLNIKTTNSLSTVRCLFPFHKTAIRAFYSIIHLIS